MIRSVTIESIRGVREGTLGGLTPLTILTGPNGCGKSTVLDAILIGGHPSPSAGVVQAVARHPASVAGAKALVTAPPGAPSRIALLAASDKWTSRVVWRDDSPANAGVMDRAAAKGLAAGLVAIRVHGADDRGPKGTYIADVTNRHDAWDNVTTPAAPQLKVIDASQAQPLSDLYSEVVRLGGKPALLAALAQVHKGAVDLENLSESGHYSLHIVYVGGAVQSALAGDGVHAFLQIALGLAAAQDGTVLLEEPEVYQHPRALQNTAAAIVQTVKRGVQVILTTHSNELIDDLLYAAEQAGLPIDQLSLHTLDLQGGKLSSISRDGKELAFARGEMRLDMR